MEPLVSWGRASGLGGLWRCRLRLPRRRGRPLELRFLGLGHSPSEVVTLRPGAGREAGVRPGGGGEGHPAGGGADIAALLLLLLLLDLVLRMVLLEPDVPGQAAHRRHRLELVDDVPGDEVNVVVTELDAGVADSLPPQLVELGVVHPLDTLRQDTQFNIQGGTCYL